jgi:hypothetical protein
MTDLEVTETLPTDAQKPNEPKSTYGSEIDAFLLYTHENHF